jgi:SPP1 family predicted phage head-tail adaptor
MRSGKLRHRVILQNVQPVQDTTTGEVSDEWADVATVWAAVEPLSVREFTAAQAVQSKVTTMIIIRYRQGVDASMRILFDDKIYNIEGILADKKSGKEYLTLPCSEGVNNG